MINKSIRKRIEFQSINLSHSLPDVGNFDVIFLRNILIYFSEREVKDILCKVVKQLKNGGLIFVGHAERIRGLKQLKAVSPTVYQKIH